MFATAPFAEVEFGLSASRLASYRAFFKARNDAEVIAAFQWNQTVAAALWPLVSLVELTLRNRLHAHLASSYGREWYRSAHFTLGTQANQKVADVLSAVDVQGNPVCTSPDDLVAGMTFGFWVEVLRRVPADRRWRTVRAVFPGYGPVADKAAWVSPANTWTPLQGRLERHKAFRDRVAHHRPLWRWRYYPTAGGPLVLPANPGAAMTAIRQEAANLELSLKEMSKDLLLIWKGSLSQRIFSSLTTSVGLHYAIHRPEEVASQVQPFRSPGYRGAAQDLHSHGPARLI